MAFLVPFLKALLDGLDACTIIDYYVGSSLYAAIGGSGVARGQVGDWRPSPLGTSASGLTPLYRAPHGRRRSWLLDDCTTIDYKGPLVGEQRK